MSVVNDWTNGMLGKFKYISLSLSYFAKKYMYISLLICSAGA
jgi:hypothetical protein